MVCGPLQSLRVDQSKESIFLSIISECKGVHRCQVLQLDGEEEEEEEVGDRRRGGGRGAEGRIELARPHGKNWICFHSSSNKQWGNFASAHLWLNTLTLRHSRPAILELWVSCYEQNICRKAQNKSCCLMFVLLHQRALHWPSIYSSAAFVLIRHCKQVHTESKEDRFKVDRILYKCKAKSVKCLLSSLHFQVLLHCWTARPYPTCIVTMTIANHSVVRKMKVQFEFCPFKFKENTVLRFPQFAFLNTVTIPLLVKNTNILW